MSVLAAALSTYAIPLGALVLSAAALLYSVLTLRQHTESDLISNLYTRIDDLEGQVKQTDAHCDMLERKVSDLQDENFRLMRRLLTVEKNNGG